MISYLDLHEVDGLHEPGLCGEHAGVETPPGGGDDLAASAVDGVSVQGDVVDVEADTAQVLVAEDALLGGPLEAGDDGVLDLVEVLHSLGAVDEDVGSVGVGAEAPDLTGLGDVVLVLVGQVATTGLEVVAGVDLTL